MCELKSSDKRDLSVIHAEALEDTKEERRLLNYERFLDYWDKHENMVRQHFKQKAT